MVIDYDIVQVDEQVVTMGRLKSSCTCWGPWFKD